MFLAVVGNVAEVLELSDQIYEVFIEGVALVFTGPDLFIFFNATVARGFLEAV